MIRKLLNGDIDRVADIWLKTNLKAHDFIPEQCLEFIDLMSQAGAPLIVIDSVPSMITKDEFKEDDYVKGSGSFSPESYGSSGI